MIDARYAPTQANTPRRICPNCLGEGSIETLGPPGWFDLGQDAWYPSEHMEPCEECQGWGVK